MATTFTELELKMVVILAHEGVMARKEALEASGLCAEEALLALMETALSLEVLEKAIRMTKESAPESREHGREAREARDLTALKLC